MTAMGRKRSLADRKPPAVWLGRSPVCSLSTLVNKNPLAVAKQQVCVTNCQTLAGSADIIASLDVAMDQWAGSHWKGTFVVGRIGAPPSTRSSHWRAAGNILAVFLDHPFGSID